MDGGLEANSIDIDHNAMLASNPKKNAAFLRVFGNYVGGGKSSTLKTAPKGATQLSESTSGGSKGSGSDENSKLAQQMQAELTAGSEDEESYTPHCEITPYSPSSTPPRPPLLPPSRASAFSHCPPPSILGAPPPLSSSLHNHPPPPRVPQPSALHQALHQERFLLAHPFIPVPGTLHVGEGGGLVHTVSLNRDSHGARGREG